MLDMPQWILKLVLVATLPVRSILFTTDPLQNIYVVTPENSIVKTDSQGNVLYATNQNKFGKLNFIDATDPMKIILSYPDYSEVVIADNTLSDLASISLKQAGIFTYKAICYSPSSNNIWVFDTQDYKLKKIDRSQNIVFESSDMFTLLGHIIHPIQMTERDQWLYVNDPEEGIVVFDLFGAYYQTLPLKNISSFQVIDGKIFFEREGKLGTYDMSTLEIRSVAFDAITKIQSFRIEKDLIYLMQDDSVFIYRY